MKLVPGWLAAFTPACLLSGESCSRLLGGFTAQTTACGLEGRLKGLVCGGLVASRHFAEVRCEFLSTTDTEEGSLLLLLTLSIFMVSACIE